MERINPITPKTARAIMIVANGTEFCELAEDGWVKACIGNANDGVNVGKRVLVGITIN